MTLYSPDEFKINFRMTKSTCEVIYGHISGVLRNHPTEFLTDSIPNHKRRTVRNIFVLHFFKKLRFMYFFRFHSEVSYWSTYGIWQPNKLYGN